LSPVGCTYIVFPRNLGYHYFFVPDYHGQQIKIFQEWNQSISEFLKTLPECVSQELALKVFSWDYHDKDTWYDTRNEIVHRFQILLNPVLLNPLPDEECQYWRTSSLDIDDDNNLCYGYHKCVLEDTLFPKKIV